MKRTTPLRAMSVAAPLSVALVNLVSETSHSFSRAWFLKKVFTATPARMVKKSRAIQARSRDVGRRRRRKSMKGKATKVATAVLKREETTPALVGRDRDPSAPAAMMQAHRATVARTSAVFPAVHHSQKRLMDEKRMPVPEDRKPAAITITISSAASPEDSPAEISNSVAWSCVSSQQCPPSRTRYLASTNQNKKYTFIKKGGKKGVHG